MEIYLSKHDTAPYREMMEPVEATVFRIQSQPQIVQAPKPIKQTAKRTR